MSIYVDGVLELDYVDPNPLLAGGISFETLDNSEAYLDYVIVTTAGTVP